MLCDSADGDMDHALLLYLFMTLKLEGCYFPLGDDVLPRIHHNDKNAVAVNSPEQFTCATLRHTNFNLS